MKIVAILLSYRRVENTRRIIKDVLRSRSKVDELIVINNNPEEKFKYKKITVINCNKNFGVHLRNAVALISDATHILTLDDDATIGKKTVGNLIKWHKKYPQSVIGYYGVRLNNEDNENPYWNGKRYKAEQIFKPMPVEVIGGRIAFFKRRKLGDAMKIFAESSIFPKERCEDILISYGSFCKTGWYNYVVPGRGEAGYQELPEMGHGLSFNKGEHKADRELAIRIIRKKYKEKL